MDRASAIPGRAALGLPVAMERKLALRKSAALRECHCDGATHPSELILELQVAANQHIRVFVVKVRRNLFPNLGPWVHLLLSKEVYKSSPFVCSTFKALIFKAARPANSLTFRA
jgi:hypothetical protein